MMLYSILAGIFKLDGGALFGVVPKRIWNKMSLADEHNLVELAMRCLLVETGNRLILIDTGIGNKLPAKIAPHYCIHPDISLLDSLKKKGFEAKDITDVILSHLHLDHAGGAILQQGENQFKTTFPNAMYWSNTTHWLWATKNPNPREKPSFRRENLQPLLASQQLKMIDKYMDGLPPEISIHYAHGHTKAMMMPLIDCGHRKILFAADLLPSVHHIPIAYIPAYDIDPLLSMREKATVFLKGVQEELIFFLDHDADNECCTLKQSDNKIQLDACFKLESCF